MSLYIKVARSFLFLYQMDIQKIFQKLHIEQLNTMQERVGEALIGSDSDVVVLSPTGSGKTLAYLLPLIQMVDASSDAVQALVVVPGRELALQSDQVLRSMASGVRSVSCYGGRATMDEHRVLKDVCPQVVFGTPGRLNDHLDKGNISRYSVRWLIIDEFDKCLQMGFQEEMRHLMESLPGLRRRVLLSATDAEEIPHFVSMNHVQTLSFLTETDQTPSRVTLYEVKSPVKDKLETLRQLLLSFGDSSSIVFLNYRDSVERVNDYLHEKGFVTSCFHGGLEQKQREAALYQFANGSANVLVSTDLASRGLDIPNIAHIIHYHMPESEDGYVHRVGRTARWDATGNAYFITGPEEHVPDYVEGNIEPYEVEAPENAAIPQPRMTTIYIGKGKKDNVSRGDIVGFLCKKGGLNASEIGKIDVNDRYTYVAVKREKANQVLRQTQGEKIKGIKTVIERVR